MAPRSGCPYKGIAAPAISTLRMPQRIERAFAWVSAANRLGGPVMVTRTRTS